MKRYPDEFEVPPSRWMRWLGGAKAQLGGAPEPSEGVWVCTKCGHNMG